MASDESPAVDARQLPRAVELPARVRLRRAGDTGTLVELEDASLVHHVARWLSTGEITGSAQDIVPGASTVLVIAATDIRGAILERLRELPPVDPSGNLRGRTLHIPARYDGPDLATVCDRLGLSAHDFVHAHTSIEFVVSYFGFTPGFPYLSALPAALRLPRRAVPRTTVPAGSVAIAEEFTVIYPGNTPGGWNLVARSSGPPVWDSTREPPNTLSIGDRVVFRAAS